MLELNNYYIQKVENLTDLFTIIFTIVDDIYNDIIPISIRNRRNIKDSKLCDSEIITISIVGELLTIDSEKAFFSLLSREYSKLFPKLGDRTRFNRTKWIRQLIFKVRRRIKTSFSQLTEQLNLNKVKSKSMLGFITRISIKVLGHNISFLINKLIGNYDYISKIKSLVFG